MAEVRCPMCSKANPEDADVCEFCGARLTPLVGGASEEAQQRSGGNAGEGADGVPDWLSRIRERAEQEAPPPEEQDSAEEDSEDDLDWLGRLRAAEGEEGGPPEGDVPAWAQTEDEPEAASPDAEPEAEADDWLSRLREESDEAEVAAEPEPSQMEPEGEEPLAPELDDFSEERPEEPEPKSESPVERAPTGELPGWLSDTDVDFDAMEGPPGSEPEQDPFAGEEAVERPDWFGEFEGAGEEAPAAADEQEPVLDADEELPAGELPSWLEDVEEPADEGEATAPAFSDEEQWPPEEPGIDLEPVQPEPEQPEPEQPELEQPDSVASQPEPSTEAFEPEQAAESDEGGEVDWSDFDWDEVSEEEVPEPEGFEDLPAPEADDELPHVPALIADGEGGPRFEETDDFDLDAIELPDWLADAQAGEPEGAEPAREGDLAPATIPSWLEAMRPVETFRPLVDVDSEEDDVVESVGPLAGLRGVLLAEPVVAKPRSATATGARLQVSERQYAQAELLQRIVEEEEHERTFARGAQWRLPLVRWIVSLVLLLAVLVPPLTGLPAFATPERVSRDLGPLVETVNALPAEQPALIVFDYEPGYSAELNAVAGALLEHLFAREMNVVTVSTRPTGPPLALDLVAQAGQPHAIENGRNYLHLGYLSGGPTAVQLFSAAPRQAILEGFMVPTDLPSPAAWDAPILQGVQQLSDFGMVAVVASGTDSARTWAEQAHPYMGESPLIMVLSAGAEPLIRPYFESLDPQVDGILTGLRSAVAYESINGRPGQAQARWNAFGSGALAAQAILLAGTLYGLVTWILARRRE